MLLTLLLASLLLYSVLRGIDAFSALRRGAEKGLSTLMSILPALLILFPVITLLRASGLPELLGRELGPLLRRLGIPEATVPLMLLRPFSGSAALGIAAELITAYGPDSPVGRCAAVMLGSSETSFYVLSVYFGAAGVRGSRWAIPAALCADLVCFLSSAWICRVIWG